MTFTPAANTLKPEFHPFYHPLPSLVPSKHSLTLVGPQDAPQARRQDFDEIEEEEVRQVTAAEGLELERIIERLDRIMAGTSKDKPSSHGTTLGSCFMTGVSCVYGAEVRGEGSNLSHDYSPEGDKKSVTTMTMVDPNADTSRRVEIMKLELLAEMAALKSSLLSEIAKSRAREEELRNELAHSRAMTKDLQAKLTKYETTSPVQTLSVPKNRSSSIAKNVFANANYLNSRAISRPAPLRPRRKEPDLPPSSFCNLRNLARQQVVRSVGEKCSRFFKEVQAKNPTGLFRWEYALDWLEHHPAMVDSLGLHMQDLRLT